MIPSYTYQGFSGTASYHIVATPPAASSPRRMDGRAGRAPYGAMTIRLAATGCADQLFDDAGTAALAAARIRDWMQAQGRRAAVTLTDGEGRPLACLCTAFPDCGREAAEPG